MLPPSRRDEGEDGFVLGLPLKWAWGVQWAEGWLCRGRHRTVAWGNRRVVSGVEGGVSVEGVVVRGGECRG